jgi:hypothetical protein
LTVIDELQAARASSLRATAAGLNACWMSGVPVLVGDTGLTHAERGHDLKQLLWLMLARLTIDQAGCGHPAAMATRRRILADRPSGSVRPAGDAGVGPLFEK